MDRTFVVDVPLGDSGEYYRLVESDDPAKIAEVVRILLACERNRPHTIKVYSIQSHV